MAIQHHAEEHSNQEGDFEAITNGPGGSAILAAGIGAFFLGLFSILGDAFQFFHNFFIFYNPTGPLSGVTTSAIIIWLGAWYVLSKRWEHKTLNMATINRGAFVLLALGLLLTFPPFMDLLQGK
jgi:hypothetical protein